MKKIVSAANPTYRELLSLMEGRTLKKSTKCIVSGKKLISELKLPILYEVICEGAESLFPTNKVIELSTTLFEEINPVGVQDHLAVVQQPQIEAWNGQTLHGLTLMTPLGDPNNLGALLRSAEAFGVNQVILLKEACHPFHPRSIKASAGSALRLKMYQGPALKDIKIPVTALDLKGESIYDYQFKKDETILVGEEGPGLPKLPHVNRVTIPTHGVESLNAVVATSIVLYECMKRR